MLEILRLNDRPNLGLLLAFIDLNRLRRSHGAIIVFRVKSLAAVLKAQQGSAGPQPEQGLLVNSDAGNGVIGNERAIFAEIHELPVAPLN